MKKTTPQISRGRKEIVQSEEDAGAYIIYSPTLREFIDIDELDMASIDL